MPDSSRARLWALRTLLVLWAVGTGALTLRDTGYSLAPVASHPLCIACGTRGFADVLANCLLFVPLGLLLGWLRGARFAIVAAALITLLIEGAQLFLPGRDPAFQDLVANTAGGLLGTVLARGPSRTAVASTAAALVGLAWLLPAVLLSPVQPHGPLFGQLTHSRPELEDYSGSVLRASVGGFAIDPRDLDRPDSVRAALIRRESLSIELVVGDEPAALAPILSIFDGEAREMLLIGALGEDLLLRAWTLARELRLDHPDIRWAGAFAGVAVGDTITLQIAPDRGSWCARVGSDQGCHMAPGPGDGYGFLLAVEGGPQWLRWLAATVWGFLLGAAIGLSVPGPRLAIGIACAVAAAGLGLGLVTPDLRPDLWHGLTLVAGSLVGTSTSSEAIELIRFARGSQRAPRLRLSPMPVEPQRQSP